MPRKSPFKIDLSPTEREELQGITAKYTLSYFEVVRAKIVLLASEGLENKEIGARLNLPRQIVSKWRKRFYQHRLPGLQDLARPGRPRAPT